MIDRKRSAEQQLTDEANRKALNPLASRQRISDSQAEPEFKEIHKRLKAERLFREATNLKTEQLSRETAKLKDKNNNAAARVRHSTIPRTRCSPIYQTSKLGASNGITSSRQRNDLQHD
jgi:hypothetical protein